MYNTYSMCNSEQLDCYWDVKVCVKKSTLYFHSFRALLALFSSFLSCHCPLIHIPGSSAVNPFHHTVTLTDTSRTFHLKC